jgi:hypothetical protein
LGRSAGVGVAFRGPTELPNAKSQRRGDAENGRGTEVPRGTSLTFLGCRSRSHTTPWTETLPKRGASGVAFTNKNPGSMRDRVRLPGCSLRLGDSASLR